MHKPRMQLLASFDIAYLQYLDERGSPTQVLPDFAAADSLCRAYRQMLLARLVDGRAVKLQRTGRLGTYPSSLGQEAIGVGIGSAMQASDVYCPYYRETGALLERGVSIEEIFAIWGGDERGQNFQRAPHDLPICVPIASQILHAAGVAFALQYQNASQPLRVAVTCAGDGATSKGDFYEAINLAGVWKLPLVVIINNNQWAISVSRNAQTAALSLAQKAIAAGIPSLQVDGNDVIAVRWAVNNGIERARRGEGPSLIEAVSYRLSDHTTADDASRYCPQSEREAAEKLEPLGRLKQYLCSQGAWSSDHQIALEEELAQVLERALHHYNHTPKDAPNALFDHLYARLPEAFYDQYDSLLNCSERHS